MHKPFSKNLLEALIQIRFKRGWEFGGSLGVWNLFRNKSCREQGTQHPLCWPSVGKCVNTAIVAETESLERGESP